MLPAARRSSGGSLRLERWPGKGFSTLPDSAVLRADFAVPADFVSIQSSTPDNGGFRLEAYDVFDNLLEFDADSGRGVVFMAINCLTDRGNRKTA